MHKQNKPKYNTAIISSIPLDRKLKAYYVRKYIWLAEHNGLEYASSIFKQMREIALAYRSDYHRVEKREWYMSQMPVRKNGWLSKLFGYLDSQPSYVLNFLKLYCGLNEPTISVPESAHKQDQYLKTVSSDTQVPKYLRDWIRLFQSKLKWSDIYCNAVFDVHHPAHAYVKGHSYSDFIDYMKRWHWYLRPPKGSNEYWEGTMVTKEPLPEMYKDFTNEETSISLERDLWNLACMEAYAENGGFFEEEGPIPADSLSFVERHLNPSLWTMFEDWRDGIWSPPWQKSFLDGLYVGHIHHIPKKGTTKRRPIAVPNRFLQMGMTPAYRYLESITQHLPKDATFNQGRFDIQIQNRVNNPNLYIGSVDLSQATDNLPFRWFQYIWKSLFEDKAPVCVRQSWKLFCDCTTGPWNNDGILSRWTVGQPLGCLPSFQVLALTHNLILESLAFSLGYGHSPYAILGDDLVVFSKKLRRRYISDFTNRNIPLSLHKSYEGNLTEFAGKTYIRNQQPFYTSDQSAVTFTNLFDWQRATGILIPWNKLPTATKRRFKKACQAEGIGNNQCSLVYDLIQESELGHSSHPLPLGKDEELLVAYFTEYYIREEIGEPAPNWKSGITHLFGHPITYLDYGYAEKHDHKQRYRTIGLPEWYKRKFRPASTTLLIHCGSKAVIDIKGEA